jgi:hypothetical protein
MISSNVIQLDERRQPGTEGRLTTTITPKVLDEPVPTPSPKSAKLEDIYDLSEPTPAFAATARARFSTITATLSQARDQDGIDRDEAVNLLKAELPRSFALDGWSEGALAIITALYHGLRNGRGVALNDAQYTEVSKAVTVLRDRPFLRFDHALDHIEALQAKGFETEPLEAALLQTAWLDA